MSVPLSPKAQPHAVRSARGALLAWYRAVARDLPWRRTRDPYAVWVSEVMLQQTTVKAVLGGYYDRFLAAFPDLPALARASEDALLRAWSGLGYYHRARNLQRAARTVLEGGATRLPRTAAELRELPGIGPYTAAAIASICHDEPVAVVDGNVERVMARIATIGGSPRHVVARKAIAELAGALLDPDAPGDWNQAVMELGATVCSPRDPACGACPLSAWCAARAAGDPERWPEPTARRTAVDVLRGALLVRRAGSEMLFARVPAGVPNAGLLELPSATLPPGAEPCRAMASAFPGAGIVAARGRVRHTITHHRITTWLVEATWAGPVNDGWCWIGVDAADGEALTGEARKLLKLAARSIK